MLKDFKDDHQSNSGIIRFSWLVIYVFLDYRFQLFELLFKTNFRRFHNENKKTDLKALSKSFASS